MKKNLKHSLVVQFIKSHGQCDYDKPATVMRFCSQYPCATPIYCSCLTVTDETTNSTSYECCRRSSPCVNSNYNCKHFYKYSQVNETYCDGLP